MEIKTKGKRILPENEGSVENQAKLWKPPRSKIDELRQTFEGEELRSEFCSAPILTSKQRNGGKLTGLDTNYALA